MDGSDMSRDTRLFDKEAETNDAACRDNRLLGVGTDSEESDDLCSSGHTPSDPVISLNSSEPESQHNVNTSLKSRTTATRPPWWALRGGVQLPSAWVTSAHSSSRVPTRHIGWETGRRLASGFFPRIEMSHVMPCLRTASYPASVFLRDTHQGQNRPPEKGDMALV